MAAKTLTRSALTSTFNWRVQKKPINQTIDWRAVCSILRWKLLLEETHSCSCRCVLNAGVTVLHEVETTCLLRLIVRPQMLIDEPQYRWVRLLRVIDLID